MSQVMPLPLDVLADARQARIELEGVPISEGLAAAPRLLPRVFVFSAQRPMGVPLDAQDGERQRVLLNTVKQKGLVFHPVQLSWRGQTQEAVAVQGCTRAEAVKLAYKRKQWCVWELGRETTRVIYTGLNSRMK